MEITLLADACFGALKALTLRIAVDYALILVILENTLIISQEDVSLIARPHRLPSLTPLRIDVCAFVLLAGGLRTQRKPVYPIAGPTLTPASTQ